MDLLLRILLVCIIFFVPFSFAGAEPWAFSVLQALVAVLLGGLLFSRRTFIYTPLFKPVLYLLALLALYAGVQSICPQTLLDSPAPFPSTLMRLYTLEHLSYFVTYLVLVFCVMQLVQNTKQVASIVFWLTVCAVAIALCALGLPKGDYIYVLTGARNGFGPFLNRNHGGIYLAASAVLCLGWAGAMWANRHHTQLPKQRFYSRQIWAILIGVMLGISAVFSRSRGGMLSLATGLFTLGLLGTLYVPRYWPKRIKYLLITLAIFATGAYWAGTHMEQINAFAHRRAMQDTSIETRKMLYRAADIMLEDYPVWGIGIGALPVVVTSYLEAPISSYVERLHSDWLEILVGIGYVGAILLLPGLLYFMYLVLRRLRLLSPPKQIKLAALIASLGTICTGAIADFPFFIPATACLFFILTALACAASFWKEKQHTWHPGWIVRVGIFIMFLMACIVPLQKTISWRYFLFGRNYKTEMHLKYYEKGLAAYPSPRAAVRLGNAYYNAFVRATDTADKAHWHDQAYQTAVTYLQKYPKDKELSILYMRTRPAPSPAAPAR